MKVNLALGPIQSLACCEYFDATAHPKEYPPRPEHRDLQGRVWQYADAHEAPNSCFTFYKINFSGALSHRAPLEASGRGFWPECHLIHNRLSPSGRYFLGEYRSTMMHEQYHSQLYAGVSDDRWELMLDWHSENVMAAQDVHFDEKRKIAVVLFPDEVTFCDLSTGKIMDSLVPSEGEFKNGHVSTEGDFFIVKKEPAYNQASHARGEESYVLIDLNSREFLTINPSNPTEHHAAWLSQDVEFKLPTRKGSHRSLIVQVSK